MTCPVSGKVPYDSKADALSQYAKIKRDKRRKGVPEMDAYKCPHCPKWHLRTKSLPRPIDRKKRMKLEEQE